MAPATFRVFARALRAAADVFEAAALEAAAERADWVDQTSSPLGSRRHISATRRRMAAGLEGAARVGRRYLLSGQALTEELAGSTAAAPAEAAAGDYASRVRAELRMVQGGAR